ncbi:MAG: hypothetical protein U0939_09700 [Pirellulales bacterium]
MMRRSPVVAGLFVAAIFLACGATTVCAQTQDRYYEQNGILIREQVVVERKPFAQWEWEERQVTTYREEYRTTFREDQRTMQVPVTVASSNGGPPVTRWETRTQIVRTPVVIRSVVPETSVVRVPVRRLGFVAEEKIARIPLGPAPPTATAARPWLPPQ